MFVIYNIGPSRLPSTDVVLLKRSARYNVTSKRRNNQLSKFSFKDINVLVILASC